MYLGIAKTYFGVWSPLDLPTLAAPFHRASARRLLRLRLRSPSLVTRSHRFPARRDGLAQLSVDQPDEPR